VGVNYQEGDRVVSLEDSKLYQCRGGAATPLCDDPGYEPGKDERAAEAWEPLYRCARGDGFELRVINIAASDLRQCKTGGSVTLTATLVQESGIGRFEPVKVAFYHTASKRLIGVADIVVPDEFEAELKVSAVFNNPPPVSDITVVADDDGTGCGVRLEYNDLDNIRADRLLTCIPKLPPL
jgi:hypothetical protein